MRGTLVRPSEVKPFALDPKYESRMLLDHTNTDSKKVHINHGTLKAGESLLPASAHGKEGEGHDETYVIMKGSCKLELDGEMLDIKEGDVIFIPGGIYHGLDNSDGSEDVELLTIWPGVPPEGVNSIYDERVKAWGKAYKTIHEK
jgi:mannose-6-phosphate isomerase-like protein (cupin superfamily)